MNSTESSERKAFEQWYVTNAFDYARDPIGSRYCSLQWDAWQAARASGSAAPAEPEAMTDDEANRRHYRGNTISYVYDKAKAYGDEIMRVWFVLKDVGKHPGRTDDVLHEVVRSALASPAPAPAAEPASPKNWKTIPSMSMLLDAYGAEQVAALANDIMLSGVQYQSFNEDEWRAAPAAETADAWLPMDASPRDGSLVLLRVPTRYAKWTREIYVSGRWFGSYWVILNADEAVHRVEPTGWMPGASTPIAAEVGEPAELPPLPEPELEGVDYEIWGQNAKMDCFTADQMRAYARAAMQQQAKP